ncbi:MAG: YchJ family metal-binding protein [Desulfuromonadales bacterium]|nr:YchJ family metal-binding protein [Desulfuromonadales bacterium]
MALPTDQARSVLTGLSPVQVIRARIDAFARGDFALIFDSYHAESNFRLQFARPADYLRHAREQLAGVYRIDRALILRDDISGDEARVVTLWQVEVGGQLLRYAELAWLRRERGAWRYHRGQRWDENLPADVAAIDFAAFERLEPRVIF